MKTKLLTLFVALIATSVLWASNVITYTATEKLPQVTGDWDEGLHTNAFNVAISSHTFSNGTGTITFTGAVTTIGSYAFCNCSGLTSVTIPNSVTTIGYDAFYKCSGLTSVTIPNSVTTIGGYAFGNCSGLTSITIPNSVTTIGSSAFYKCSGLTSVTIPNSVTTIGSSAFYRCSGLTKTNYTGTIADWCKIKFGDDNANPMCCSHNFYINDVEIKDLVIPDGVDAIGDYAFSGCSGLTSVTIPNSVTTIGSSAFSGCSGLTSITIGNSVTTIGSSAFSGCSGLTSITIPNSVTTIGDHAFYDCSGLRSVTIPNSVTTIGSSAFYRCSGLTSAVYNANCFAYMPTSYHGSYTIPNGIKQIGVWAFDGCYGLTSVTIPNSVTTIGSSAFYNCSGLNSITCEAITPPTCEDRCFYNVPTSIPVYVPARSVDAYKSANEWRNFINIQVSPEDHAMITCLASNGTIKGGGKQIKGDTCFLEVTPNYGYHFTQWSDGNTDNPRSIVVTQDSTFTAEFAKNIYTFDVQTEDSVMGSVAGTKSSSEYQTNLTVGATSNYGYHFDHWSDGSKDNPHTISLTQNTTLIAYFAKNIYSVSSVSQNGTIYGQGNYEYLDTCSLVATPDWGYHFTQWNDSNTDNPRSFVVTQDTIFTAQIDIAKSGQCGENLYWTIANNTLVISGSGDMYDYTSTSQPEWYLSQETITKIVLNEGITHIGDYAFNGYKKITNISIPNSAETIGDYAFANDTYLSNVVIGANVTEIGCNAFAGDFRIEEITSFAAITPNVCTSTFDGLSKDYIYLFVPANSVRKYQIDPNWNVFDIQTKSAETTPIESEQPVVTPSASEATITWPQTDDADTYTLEIKKNGELVCILTFNSQGQLINIAFTLARNNERPANYATKTLTGYQFTVTGLESGTAYTYAVTAKDASQQVLQTYSGDFTTTGGTATDLEMVEGSQCTMHNVKFIKNGHLLIERNGNLYNAHGARVK